MEDGGWFLEREGNSDFVPDTLIDGGIYYHDRNGETRPTVVSECDVTVGGKRATAAPANRAIPLGFAATKIASSGGSGGWKETGTGGR